MPDTTQRGELEPFYFGLPESPLFGCYHPAVGTNVGSWGIVLCPPIGREYNRSHRSFRLLAARLAHAGFPVLRFDFFGCGDSTGDFEEAHPERWLEDIDAAIAALRQKCRPAHICLVGLRLGATLALMAGARQENVPNLVLWEPFITGQAFLDDLAASHIAYMHQPPVPHPRVGRGEGSTEMMGLSFSDSTIEALGQMDLVSVGQIAAHQVLLVEGGESGEETSRLMQDLTGRGIRVCFSRLPSPEVWRNDQHALVPGKTLHAITSWISEVCR